MKYDDICRQTIEILEKKGNQPGRFTKHPYRKGIEKEWGNSYLQFEKRKSGAYRITSCWYDIILEFKIEVGFKILINRFNNETEEHFEEAYIEAME